MGDFGVEQSDNILLGGERETLLCLLDKCAGSQDWPVLSCVVVRLPWAEQLREGPWTFHFPPTWKQGSSHTGWCLQSCGPGGLKWTRVCSPSVGSGGWKGQRSDSCWDSANEPVSLASSNVQLVYVFQLNVWLLPVQMFEMLFEITVVQWFLLLSLG